jgi:hypothetical protein
VNNSLKEGIQTHTPRVSILSLRLPEALLALGPAEAATVITLDWDALPYSSYVQGAGTTSSTVVARGYRIRCRLSILIRSAHLVWENQATFWGQPPSASEDIGGDVYGRAPYDEIVRYVLALPGIAER